MANLSTSWLMSTTLAAGQMPATTARMMPAEGSRAPKSLSRLTKGTREPPVVVALAEVVTVSV